MSTLLDLAKLLSRLTPVPFKRLPGAIMVEDATPSHSFVKVIAPVLEGSYCIVLPSRDWFDEDLATSVLAFVCEQESRLDTAKPVELLEGFAHPQYSFDTVAVLSPVAAQLFKRDGEPISERAFAIFPIYRCELSGDESAELLDLIRHDVLSSLDWKRSPCPKVTMACRNKRAGTGSRSTLSELATVLYQLDRMDGAEGSWIELINYAKHQCRIEWTTGHYVLRFPGQHFASLEKLAVEDAVKKFLVRDDLGELFNW